MSVTSTGRTRESQSDISMVPRLVISMGYLMELT
jgi:hypothetical protein